VPSEVVTPAEVVDPEVEVEVDPPADDPSGALAPADVPDPVPDEEVDAPTEAPPAFTPTVTPAPAPVSPPPPPPPPPVPAPTPEVPGGVPVPTVGPDPPSVPGPPGAAVGSPVLGSRGEEDPPLPPVEGRWGRVRVAEPPVWSDTGLFSELVGVDRAGEPGPAGTRGDEPPGRIAARPRSITLGRGNPIPLKASSGIGTRTNRPITNQLLAPTLRRPVRTGTVLPLPKSRPDMRPLLE